MIKQLMITGASRGIGKAIAQQFLNENWMVTNLSRHRCDLDKVKNITLDLSQPNWPQEIINSLPDADVTCLVHNAAAHDNDSINSIKPERMREILEINLTGPLKLNQLILPRMKAGSSIIYIGSTLSEKTVKNTASYSISKHAVVGMMRATCQDLDDTGIHTCCVCPGFTDTEMLKQHLGNDPKIIESIKQMVTARRFIKPQEIANLVYFCANNPVINGSVMHANLGQVER